MQQTDVSAVGMDFMTLRTVHECAGPDHCHGQGKVQRDEGIAQDEVRLGMDGDQREGGTSVYCQNGARSR